MKLSARHYSKQSAGFTLIELLVVIGILAVLLAITLIAINPARQFGQANDTKKRSDALQILNAVGQYASDPNNKGQLPPDVVALAAGTKTEISHANFANLCTNLLTTYISALPVNPATGGNDIASTDCACPAGNTSA